MDSLAPCSPGLTSRQYEIFRCLLAGMSDKEIAFQFGLKEWTVKTQVQRMREKLNVNNRVQMVIWAYAHREDTALWLMNFSTLPSQPGEPAKG